MIIGIVSAMESELKLFCGMLEDIKTEKYASLNYYSGKIGKNDIIVCNCGVGKVNAAMHTQILIDKYNPDIIINNGVAGALADELDVFDVVVADKTLYHDMPQSVIEQFDPLEAAYFPDSVLVSAFKAVNENIHIGTIASGDQFISDSAVKAQIIESTAASCVDMESAAIAHTAFLNGIRFVIIRVMSDKADDDAGMSFAEFEKKAAEMSCHNTLRLIEAL